MTRRPLFHSCMVVLLAAAAGCGSTPPEKRGPGVTLGELGPGPQLPGSAEPATPAPSTAVFMLRVTLPLERPVEAAWELTSGAPAPPLDVGVWQSNGVRLGVLDASAWSRFEDALPTAIEQRETRLLASDDRLPIVTSPRLVRPIRVDLTVPPRSPRETWARRGRMQLLAGLDAEGPHERAVELVPHHVAASPLVLPEALADAQTTGRTFEELAIEMDLAAGRLLIVGLDRPWDRAPPAPTAPQGPGPDAPTADDETPVASASPSPDAAAEASPPRDSSDDGAGAADPADTPDAADEPARVPQPGPAMPRVPPHLGRALFTAQRAGRPVHHVLVLSVVPLAMPSPADDPG